MGRLRQPLPFLQQFAVPVETLAKLGVIDPILNFDKQLFVDPMLLRASSHPEIAGDAADKFDAHFDLVARFLARSQRQGDTAWNAADELFRFREVKAIGLGYGTDSTDGRGIGPILRARLLRTARDIVRLGFSDVRAFLTLPFLEDNFGCDRISDMTARIILEPLLRFNERVLSGLNVPREVFRFKAIDKDWELPRNPVKTKKTPIVLVPIDITRRLPIAVSYAEVRAVADTNEATRNRVSKHVGNIWAKVRTAMKADVRDHALQSAADFRVLLELLDAIPRVSYDIMNDLDGEVFWHELLVRIANEHPYELRIPNSRTRETLRTVAESFANRFRSLVEEEGLAQYLWAGSTPRKSRAAQRLFFAMAESYRVANQLPVTVAADTDLGPVDVSFSAKEKPRARILIKTTGGGVFDSYQQNALAFRKADAEAYDVLVLIDTGRLGQIRDRISRFRAEESKAGRQTPETVYVDARSNEQ